MAEKEDRLTPEEIARRRDDAIRRALNTPKPQKTGKTPKGKTRSPKAKT